MRENIANALKEALKAKDQVALSTMRLIAAALKDRDIAARGNDNPDGISDEEILGMLQTMIKQRTESAKMYRDGDRPELAANEEAEIVIIKNFGKPPSYEFSLSVWICSDIDSFDIMLFSLGK